MGLLNGFRKVPVFLIASKINVFSDTDDDSKVISSFSTKFCIVRSMISNLSTIPLISSLIVSPISQKSSLILSASLLISFDCGSKVNAMQIKIRIDLKQNEESCFPFICFLVRTYMNIIDATKNRKTPCTMYFFF